MKKSFTLTATFASMFTLMFAQFEAQAASNLKAHADLINAQGKSVGTAELTQLSKGVEIKVTVHDLPSGTHGFHIHERGLCETPDFKSAGAHFNPTQAIHGLSHAEHHAGDMMNLKINDDGSAQVTIVNTQVSLTPGKQSLLAGQGTAFIIHAKADDQKTPPSGDSGDRIACGVIKSD